MKIEIAEKLRPFSHFPGSQLLLPGTGVEVEVFPALIRFWDLTGSNRPLIAEHHLPLTGPVTGFTVQQDLERGGIHVWGKAASGHFRYQIRGESGQICVTTREGEEKRYGADLNQAHINRERLSLGMHKTQDWELMRRRHDLKEILPLWFRLGQSVPHVAGGVGGTAALLFPCHQTPQLTPFSHLFLAGFTGMLVPRLVDEHYHGIPVPNIEKEGSPLVLLNEGSRAIRELFIQQSEHTISLLPFLPKEFHCGRMTNVACGTLGHLDIEWSKKSLRRFIFRSAQKGTVQFQVSKNLKSCRLRQVEQRQSERIPCPITLNTDAETTYFFDNLG